MIVADYPRRSISEPPDSASSLGPSTAGTSSDFSGSSRKTHPRTPHFVYKHGSKLHAFDPAKAPWPISYDKATLELYVVQTLTPNSRELQKTPL